MEPRVVEASECWSWFREGWRLFSLNPTLWTGASGVWLLTALGLAVLPFGGIVWWLLGPGVYGGFLSCASESERGQPVEVKHLFRGFTGSPQRTSLLMLGAITMLGYFVISFVVTNTSTGPTVQMGEEVRHTVSAAMIIGVFLRVLLVSMVSALVSAALLYSCPLIMFTGLDGLEALMTSVEACAKNWRPVLVIGLVYLFVAAMGFLVFLLPSLSVVAFALALIGIGLGVLVVAPVTYCASYLSYRSIFG